MNEREHWRLCSSCKEPLAFGQKYFVCSVSTCRRKRTGLTFCSLSCWEAHLPEMRHREAWAEEERAPTREQWEAEEQAEEEKAVARERRSTAASVPIETRTSAEVPRDILIVVSKLKQYIRARSGMNTSDGVTEVLSDIVRDACDQAIRRAGQADRRTVLARDFDLADGGDLDAGN